MTGDPPPGIISSMDRISQVPRETGRTAGLYYTIPVLLNGD